MPKYTKKINLLKRNIWVPLAILRCVVMGMNGKDEIKSNVSVLLTLKIHLLKYTRHRSWSSFPSVKEIVSILINSIYNKTPF